MSTSVTILVPLVHPHALYSNGLMTPAKYDEYVKSNCEDILHFICDEMLENLHQMMSLNLCPLRTPLQHELHHLEQKQYYKEYLKERLAVISKRLQEYLVITASNRQHLGTAQQMPDLRPLYELALQYRSSLPVVNRLNYMIELMAEIERRCQFLWKERALMHEQVTQVFEESIRIVCTHVTKTFQRLAPDLVHRLQTRKAAEHELQSRYEAVIPEQQNERKEFYARVIEYAEIQVQMVKDMLNISRILLNQYDPRRNTANPPTAQVTENYTKAQTRYRELDKSINIWLKVLQQHATMNVPLPIVPQILYDLQKWLEQFQRFFLYCINEWAPKPVKNAHPLAPIQVYESYHGESEMAHIREPIEIPELPLSIETDLDLEPNSGGDATEHEIAQSQRSTELLLKEAESYLSRFAATSKKQPKKKSISGATAVAAAAEEQHQVAGLLSIDPKMYLFYEQMSEQSQQQLAQDQALQQRIYARYEQLEAAIRSLSEQSDSRLTLRGAEVDKLFQEYSESLKDVHAVLQETAFQSQFHAQQYELDKRLKWLHGQQKLAADQFEVMRPRIESQASLVISLNRVLVMLQQFSAEQGKQWLQFVSEEADLCVKWKSDLNTVQQQILAFRSDTRMLLNDLLVVTQMELTKLLDQCFRDLASAHQQHLANIKALVEEHQKTVAKQRKMLDNNHEKILEMKLDDSVSKEIVKVIDQLDIAIEQRETLDWHLYKTNLQNSLIMFAASVGSMLGMLFDDPLMVGYLEYIDVYCVKESGGTTTQIPCPRKTTVAQLPDSNQVWIQLTEFPAKVDAIAMLSASQQAQHDAEQFILKRNGYEQEEKIVEEPQVDLAKMIKNLNTNMRNGS